MDYHSMKRTQLQALCKKHNIPANSANTVLADKLSELLNEKQEKQEKQEKLKPRVRTRTCIKSPSETIDESESAVSRRQSKKVRFSPEVEYQSAKKQEDVVTEPKGRRRSVAKKVDEPIVDNDNSVQIPVRQTRSRVQVLETNDVIPKKRGGKAVRDVEKTSEPVEEPVVGRVRVTRSKGQPSVEDDLAPDLGPPATKKSGRRMTKDAEVVEPAKVTVDVPVRATRSRGQKSNDENVVANPQAAKKRTRGDTKVSDSSHEMVNEDEGEKLGHGRRKKKNEESIAEVSESQHDDDKVTRQSRRNNAKKEESSAEVSESQPRAEKGLRQSRRNNAKKEESIAEVPESQHDDKKITRQTRRNKGKVEESVAEVSESQHDDEKITRQTRRNKGKVEESIAEVPESQHDKKATRSKATKEKMAQQIEEPLEDEGKKKVNRRKSVMQPKITEFVEEPVVLPATRRKSVVPKAQDKVSNKPKVETRKTVGKKQSKDASENETKAEGSDFGSHKSRKRQRDPIVEDEAIETESASKNKVKQQGSGKKTPASTKGETSKANSSKKRAKLSGTKETDSEDHAEKSHTPVSKMGNLELDEKINETELTPAIEESAKQSTRGRKKPSQSAMKETEPIQSSVKETEPTSDIDESARQSTRGRKKPSQSAMEETEPSQSAINEIEPTPVLGESARQSTRGRKKPSQSAMKETEPIKSASKGTEPTSAIDESARRSTRGKKESVQSAMKEVEPIQSAIKESEPIQSAIKETEPIQSAMIETEPIRSAIKETEPIQSAINEIEPTPVIGESARQSTRGRKKPSQSAMKETEPIQSAIKGTEPTSAIDESARRSTRGKKESVQSAMKEAEPFQSAIKESEPIQSAIKETEPIQSAMIETEPIQSVIKETEPIQSAIKESEPATAVDESARQSTRGRKKPSQSAMKETEPIKSASKGTEPTSAIDESARRSTRGKKESVQSAMKEAEPIQSAIKETEPIQSAIKETGPIQSAMIETEPIQSAIKYTEPATAIDESARQSTRGRKKHSKSAIKETEPSQSAIRETEPIPVIDESARRSTRGKKEPIQSAVKDAPLSLRKGAKSGPRPAVNATPGRVTRSGIKVAVMASLEDAEVKPSEDVTSSSVGKNKSYRKKKTSEEQSGEPSASESVSLPTEVVKENIEPAIVMEDASSVPRENASGAKTDDILNDSEALEKTDTEDLTEDFVSGKPQSPVNLPNVEDESPSGTDLSMAEAEETTTDAPEQIQEVDVNSAMPEVSEKEMEFTEPGSTSKVLKTDETVEVSAVKTVVVEESVDISIGDDDSSAVFHASLEQSTVKSYSIETEAPLEPSTVEGVEQFVADVEASTKIEKGDNDEDEIAKNQEVDDDDDDEASPQKEPISEDNLVHGTIDEGQSLEMDSLMEGDDAVPKKDDTLEASTGNDVYDVADVEKEVEFDVGLSTGNDDFEIPVYCKPDGEEGSAGADKEHEADSMGATGGNVVENVTVSGGDGEDEGVNANKDDDSDFNMTSEVEPISEPSTSNDMLTPGTPLISKDDVEEDDDNKLQFSSLPSNIKSIFDDGQDEEPEQEQLPRNDDEQEVGDDRPEPSIPKDSFDGEDDGTRESEEEQLNDTQELSNTTDIVDDGDDKSDGQVGNFEQDSGYGAEPSNVKNIREDEDEQDVGDDEPEPLNANKIYTGEDDTSHEHEHLTTNDDSAIDEQDVVDDKQQPSNADEDDKSHELEGLTTNVGSFIDEPEPLSIAKDALVDYKSDEQDEEDSEHEELTTMDEQNSGDDEPKPPQNENVPVDQEPESMSHLFEEVLCDIVVASTSKTPATDTQSDSINEQKIMGASELDEGVSSDIKNEQKAEEAELAKDNPSTEESSLVFTEEQREIIHNFASITYSVNEQTTTETFEQRTEETQLTTETLTTEQTSQILYTKEEITEQLLGDDEAHETPIKNKESPVDDTVSDRPTSSKDTNIDKQDEWGNFGFEVDDDFQKPETANRSDKSPEGVKSNQDVDTNASEEFFSLTGADMKAFFATPAAAAQTSRVKDSQPITVGFDEGADSSLKAFFATPAVAGQTSRVKDSQPIAVSFDEGADSSLKAFFATPAVAGQTSRVKDSQPIAVSFDEGADSSLKAFFATPAVAGQTSRVKDSQPITVGFDEGADSSLKAFFATPAVAGQTSRVKDSQPITVGFDEGADSSLKAFFATPAVAGQTSRVKDSQPITVGFDEGADSSLKAFFATPAVAGQTSRVKDSQPITVGFDEGADSSLKAFFATPAVAGQTSRVKDSQPITVGFDEGADSSLKAFFATPAVAGQTSRVKDDELQGTATQNLNFEDLTRDCFGDEEVDEAAGSSHHDASGLKDNSVHSGEFRGKDEIQQKGSETGDEGRGDL